MTTYLYYVYLLLDRKFPMATIQVTQGLYHNIFVIVNSITVRFKLSVADYLICNLKVVLSSIKCSFGSSWVHYQLNYLVASEVSLLLYHHWKNILSVVRLNLPLQCMLGTMVITRYTYSLRSPCKVVPDFHVLHKARWHVTTEYVKCIHDYKFNLTKFIKTVVPLLNTYT